MVVFLLTGSPRGAGQEEAEPGQPGANVIKLFSLSLTLLQKVFYLGKFFSGWLIVCESISK